MYGAVVEYNGEDELLIGRGCILLTRRFVRYGVSAHVLPGSLSDSGRQLIALIGMSKTGVAAALRKYEPTRPELLKIIMRLPVLF